MYPPASGCSRPLLLLQMREARELYIPHLAQSIANIICRSENEEFKNAAFLVLSLERPEKNSIRPRAGNQVHHSRRRTTPSQTVRRQPRDNDGAGLKRSADKARKENHYGRHSGREGQSSFSVSPARPDSSHG